MAFASTPVHPSNRGKSHFQPTVCLTDWWLVKADDDIQGRGLAVAGFTLEGKQAMRVFSSAPILKRYDVFNVETADGICVILNGFMNKDRTIENGFPSDICNYFVFGFPSYWKEYYEKFVGKESSSDDISVKNPSPHSGIEVGLTHAESHEKDFGSQGTMNVKGTQESKKTISSSVQLTQRCGSVIAGSEDNLNMSCVVSDGPEKESYSGGCSGEDGTTLELPVNLKNKVKLLSDSSCEGNINVSAVINMDAESSQINGSGGIESACHLYDGRRKRATDNSSVQSDKNNSTKANYDSGMSLHEDILSRNEVGVMTRRMSSLKLKQKNSKKSARISGGEKIRLISVLSTASERVESASVDHQPGRGNQNSERVESASVDHQPGRGNQNSERVESASVDRQPGRGNQNSEVTGLNMPTNEIQSRLLDAGSVKCGFDQVPVTPNQYNGTRKIKTRSNTKKGKSKATKSLQTPAAADNQTDKIIAGTNSLSKKVKASTVETRRKLVFGLKETPNSEKEKIPSVSPQPSSFNRSRSGRLLMPTLEYWRNQIPIYDVDAIVDVKHSLFHRTLTGIEEDAFPRQPKMGSGSTSQRNGRKRHRADDK